VPALEIEDGVSIYESLVTVEYLEEVYPQRPLFHKDPVMRAFDKIIIEAMGPVSSLQ
jgi:glutathione S-transferase